MNSWSFIMALFAQYAALLFVWLPIGLENKLSRLQRRAMRLIDPVKKVIPEIRERRETLSKKLFIRIVKNDTHLLSKYIPKRLKYTKHFKVNIHRSKKRKRSFFPFTTLLVNSDLRI